MSDIIRFLRKKVRRYGRADKYAKGQGRMD